MTAKSVADSMLPDLPADRAAVAAPLPRAPRRSQLETATFHLLLVGFLVAWQIALVPRLELSADNSWHFRLARDIASGRPIYWAGVDASRFFPDLLYSLAAYVMPFGSRFGTWVYFYHIIDILALYGALVIMAATLFEEAPRRQIFVLLTTLALSAYLIILPFWFFWLVVPGNHGGGLPICFLALALVFRMARRGWIDLLGALAFVGLTALLVGSNRLLLVTFVAPLGLAFLLAFALSRRRAVKHEAPAPAAPYLALMGLTVLAGVGGHLAWVGLDRTGWFELVARGNLPPILLTPEWVVQTLTKERLEFATAMGTSFAWDVFVCVVILAVASLAGLAAATVAVQRGYLFGEGRNRAILAVFTVLSAVLAAAFTVVKTDDSGTWHYRYLGVPSVFAIMFLCSLPLWRTRAALQSRALFATALVGIVGLAGYSALLAARNTVPAPQREEAFAQSIAALARMIERQSNGQKPFRGFAEYWLANDLNTRSDELDVALLDSVKPVFRFYNNNAVDVCAGDRFFVAFSEFKDEPRRADLIALLGEPRLVERMWVPRAGNVSVLYFDPALLKSRITDPGRQSAADLFPKLRCAS